MIKPVHVTLEPNEDNNTDGDADTIYVLPTTTRKEVVEFFNLFTNNCKIVKKKKQPFAEYVRWQARPN